MTSLSSDPSSIICNSSILQGKIILGKNNVIHPKASILANQGTITIGDNNIIEELAIISNKTNGQLYIGNNNHFQVASKWEGESIGNCNVMEIKSEGKQGANMADGCVINSLATLSSPLKSHHVLLQNGNIIDAGPSNLQESLCTVAERVQDITTESLYTSMPSDCLKQAKLLCH